MFCNERSLHIVFVRQKGFAPEISMTQDPSQNRPRRSMLGAVLTDVQFWIPLGVLAVGLLVLHWMTTS